MEVKVLTLSKKIKINRISTNFESNNSKSQSKHTLLLIFSKYQIEKVPFSSPKNNYLHFNFKI